MGVSYISNIQLIVDMITRGAWAVCLFVCLSVCHEYIYSPGCHSAAFAA